MEKTIKVGAFYVDILEIITECYLNRHDIPGWKQKAALKIIELLQDKENE